jgi:hypothetical protein
LRADREQEGVVYASDRFGFRLRYPADWNVSEGESGVEFNSPDGWAQLSLGWAALGPGQPIEQLAERLVAVRLAEVREAEVVPIKHEGGGPLEVVVSGEDSRGVRWVYHFVLSEGGGKALVVETVTTAGRQEEFQPLFDAVLESLRGILARNKRGEEARTGSARGLEGRGAQGRWRMERPPYGRSPAW